MDIALQLLQAITITLNEEQQAIITHGEGPLLVIAGPGSGKTQSLILRVMNILLLAKAQPAQVILCTYTEKAAKEMYHRLVILAIQVGYQGDISQIRVGTIHGICNQLIKDYRHYTFLSNNYRILEQFEQRLFIFQRLARIAPNDALLHFQQKWGTQWEVAKHLQEYFDKIMEELVEITPLHQGQNLFLGHLAHAYDRYGALLQRENCITFAALLKITYRLLYDEQINQSILRQFRYVFVDEYQDTNHIQEQIIMQLASTTTNLCVVGDEDQALYRFRGATVRNILEFPTTVPNCRLIQLTTNYRSHQDIISRYNQWMASSDWSNPGKAAFRFSKNSEPALTRTHAPYPSVFSIQGKDSFDEAEQFADLVSFLKEHAIISDYSQVALLMYSVKPEYSGNYIEALTRRTIPVFCPRARSYFYQEEVCLLMACFALIFGYTGEPQGNLLPHENFSTYIQKQCIEKLDRDYPASHPLRSTLKQLRAVLFNTEQQAEDPATTRATIYLTDYFYSLLASEPFTTLLQDERRMRNLVIFSKVLATFQNFYRYPSLTGTTLKKLRTDFFYIFLRLLEDGGINEYEDNENPFLTGHLQIMTIHQAKGLEFPVIVVSSLNAGHSGAQHVDRDLQPFYQRQLFEPEKRIPGFDMMRLYYVAFSRAEHLLVLAGNTLKPPKQHFDTMRHQLPQWPTIQTDLMAMARSPLKAPPSIKRQFSFTGHIQMYETCPRQYQYFREYNFIPSQQKDVFLGLLVHQTIEEIHRIALAGKADTLNKNTIRTILERVNCALLCAYEQPLDQLITEQAFTQVFNYFTYNRQTLPHIIATEIDVVVEKDGYILTGRVDLLLERKGQLEILDFKTAPRPAPNADCLIDYERQLYLYAHALEKRFGKRPTGLFIYWTAERLREDALMTFHYQPTTIQQVNTSIDTTVSHIIQQDFNVTPSNIPERHVCQRCSMHHLCISDQTISPLLTPLTVKASFSTKTSDSQ